MASTVRSMLRALMTDGVMVQFSRDGKKGKLALAKCDGNFIAIIQGNSKAFHAIRLHKEVLFLLLLTIFRRCSPRSKRNREGNFNANFWAIEGVRWGWNDFRRSERADYCCLLLLFFNIIISIIEFDFSYWPCEERKRGNFVIIPVHVYF